MVKKLNSENFQNEMLNADGTVLVDFYADWCGPCKMVSPIVDEIAETQSGITVGKVNVDESSALAAKFNVVSIPTLIVFKAGQETARLIGYKPKETILAELLS